MLVGRYFIDVTNICELFALQKGRGAIFDHIVGLIELAEGLVSKNQYFLKTNLCLKTIMQKLQLSILWACPTNLERNTPTLVQADSCLASLEICEATAVLGGSFLK